MSNDAQKPSEHAMRAADRLNELTSHDWHKANVAAAIIDQHAIAPAVAERDKRIAELEDALQAVRDWYDRDGSVGGCDSLMEDHVEPLTKKGQP